MSTRPQLRTGPGLLPGLLAVALFGLMALIAFNTAFSSSMAGFPSDVSVTASIGYSLFDLGPLQADQGVPGTEPFLLGLLLVAVVLDAALDAALVLAKREEGGETVATMASVSRSTWRPDRATTPGGTTAVDESTATDGGQQAAGDSAGVREEGGEDR